jgi:hypothetical protein
MFGLAGWLLADLMLGITMIFFLAYSVSTPLNKIPKLPEYPPTGTPTSILALTQTVTMAPTIPPTNTPQVALSPISHVVDFTLGEPSSRVRDRIIAEIGTNRPGFVLIFGTAQTSSDGDSLAAKAYEFLSSEMPDLFGTAVMQKLHFISPDQNLYGVIRLEIFVFTE